MPDCLRVARYGVACANVVGPFHLYAGIHENSIIKIIPACFKQASSGLANEVYMAI